MHSTEYGFLSDRWHGIKTLNDLNGSRNRYRGITVEVVDTRTSEKIGRMEFSTALRKFA